MAPPSTSPRSPRRTRPQRSRRSPLPRPVPVAPRLCARPRGFLRGDGRVGCLDGRHDLLSGAVISRWSSVPMVATIATPDARPCFPAVLPVVAMMDGSTDEPAWIPGTSRPFTPPTPRLDAVPVASTPCRYPPRLPASPSLPASATLASVHVPAQAWNATGAILRGRHVNPAIGIHKADELSAVNRPGAQRPPGAWADGRRIDLCSVHRQAGRRVNQRIRGGVVRPRRATASP